MKHALGIDIGSTTVKVTVINESHDILFSDYKRHFANIKGTLQDKYKNIYGLTGKDGVGDVAFTPGSYMYIAGLGEVIGDTGGVKIDESSMMTISIQNKLSVINGTVEIPKSVNTALTNGIYGFNSSKLLVTGSIPTTITVNMFDDSQYIDNSIQNSEIKLGLVGSSVNTNDNASLNAEIRDDLIYLTVLSKEKKEVETTSFFSF